MIWYRKYGKKKL